jgi:hypothetical protein
LLKVLLHYDTLALEGYFVVLQKFIRCKNIVVSALNVT